MYICVVVGFFFCVCVQNAVYLVLLVFIGFLPDHLVLDNELEHPFLVKGLLSAITSSW